MGKLLTAGAVVAGMFGSLLLLPLFFMSPAGSASAAAACTTEGFKTGTVPNGWDDDVVKAAENAGVPAAIIAAQLEAESGWNPEAVSSVGAQGLAQFMPGTWERFGRGDPFDPAAAIAAQGRYMGHLMEVLESVAKENGVPLVDLALAGYNAGPGAVQKYNGIPPYTQTQRYVAKINRAAASDYGVPCISTGTESGETTASVGDMGNTYPYPDGPYCPLDGSGCMPGAVNTATGMYKRECVDWAIIELNGDLGDTKAPYKWDNQSLLNGNGSAIYWKEQWEKHGWTVSDSPAPDAIAWFAPGAAGAGALGHVATVASINEDGTVTIEEYNGQAPPNDHEYGTRTLPAGAVTKYLYLPDEG